LTADFCHPVCVEDLHVYFVLNKRMERLDMPINKTLAAALTATALMVTPVVLAPALAQQAPVEVSEAEREAFVGAYKDVVAIEQAYAQELQAVEDEAAREALINEAQTEMAQAVAEASDISVDRYVEILRLAQTDADLQADLNARLQQ
jgi:predicted ATPase with chaperone activity